MRNPGSPETGNEAMFTSRRKPRQRAMLAGWGGDPPHKSRVAGGESREGKVGQMLQSSHALRLRERVCTHARNASHCIRNPCLCTYQELLYNNKRTRHKSAVGVARRKRGREGRRHHASQRCRSQEKSKQPPTGLSRSLAPGRTAKRKKEFAWHMCLFLFAFFFVTGRPLSRLPLNLLLLLPSAM